MGVQLSSLLNGANAIVGIGSALRALQLFRQLPPGAVVPVKFGFWGEVMNSWDGRLAYLVYPCISLSIAFAPAITRLTSREPKAPNWVRDAQAFGTVMDCVTGGALLATGALIAACTEQVPKIVNREQDALKPEWLTKAYLATLGGLYVTGYIWARRAAS
eukprot:CAMPEP_0183560704 /NCGR_PEP_ID=MMETSP0371-20130417/95593_1 /TAXON_ID=268820 /ORGANISM="Peridinium aciculiferum, Strain PAER-2" /LENGTH=159 /DNA_ID=CAMNT_0025768997 /DNA_START=53 /DNA_END=532 /DNA_ORIENTATION=+